MSRNRKKKTKYNGKKVNTYSNNQISRDAYQQNMHAYNDVSWYAKNPQILRDAASVSFSEATGNIVTDKIMNTRQDGKWTYALPGVMSIAVDLVPGSTDSQTSPVNVAARNIYSYIRHANSGATNYEAPDLMMYLLAMDQCYALFNYGKRAYGICYAYLRKNRYTPEALLTAMGFNATNLRQNLSTFRYQLNVLAKKISSMCVPAVFTLFARHSWMFSNIFKDSDSEKAQYYMFVPSYYRKLVLTEDTGTALNCTSSTALEACNQGQNPWQIATPTPGSGATVQGFIAQLESMINVILEDQEINIMSGDIQKAYSESQLFTLSEISDDYTLEPVYEPEVLPQIHNLINCGWYGLGVESTKKAWITQNLGVGLGTIKFNPPCSIFTGTSTVTIPADGVAGPKILDLHTDDATPESVMVATRLMNIPESASWSNGMWSMNFSTTGSEIVNACTVWFFGVNPSDKLTTLARFNLPGITYQFESVINGANLNTYFLAESMLSQFDMHPIQYRMYGYRESSSADRYTNVNVVPLGDLDNWTTLDKYTLWRMHETALLSEFNIPNKA